MRSAGRRVALHVGLLALNVFGIILLIGWREIVVAYHGFRLRSDPAAFDDLLGSEDGSPRREALERYARGSKGRERLLTEYLAVGMGISISLRDELKRLGTNTTENPRVSFWFKGKWVGADRVGEQRGANRGARPQTRIPPAIDGFEPLRARSASGLAGPRVHGLPSDIGSPGNRVPFHRPEPVVPPPHARRDPGGDAVSGGLREVGQ
jgi:hypothetical protein